MSTSKKARASSPADEEKKELWDKYGRVRCDGLANSLKKDRNLKVVDVDLEAHFRVCSLAGLGEFKAKLGGSRDRVSCGQPVSAQQLRLEVVVGSEADGRHEHER